MGLQYYLCPLLLLLLWFRSRCTSLSSTHSGEHGGRCPQLSIFAASLPEQGRLIDFLSSFWLETPWEGVLGGPVRARAASWTQRTQCLPVMPWGARGTRAGNPISCLCPEGEWKRVFVGGWGGPWRLGHPLTWGGGQDSRLSAGGGKGNNGMFSLASSCSPCSHSFIHSFIHPTNSNLQKYLESGPGANFWGLLRIDQKRSRL